MINMIVGLKLTAKDHEMIAKLSKQMKVASYDTAAFKIAHDKLESYMTEIGKRNKDVPHGWNT